MGIDRPDVRLRRRASVVAVLVALLVMGGACSGQPGAGTPPGSSPPDGSPPVPVTPRAPSEASGSEASGSEALSLVVFGDSWGFGAHCAGCTPWPRLLPADYRAAEKVEVTLTDLTENGGDSTSLVDELKNNAEYRDAVADADIVVVNMGLNDLEKTADPAKLTSMWSKNLDAMLDIVDKLRAGQPTAVRMVGVSNEYLSDAGLRAGLGDSASKIFQSFNQVSCAVAADHGGQCVDLRSVLNGVDGQQATDPNSQESMNAVASAVAAAGLDELGGR